MNKFQEEVCRLIHYALSSNNFFNNIYKPGYKEIFVRYLRQFPGITTEGINTWQKVDLYLKHHKLTIRALKALENYEGNRKELWKVVHYEHIFPISLLMKKLVDLGFKPKLENIIEYMKMSEVVILSKEEANLLDGNVNKLYPLEGKMLYGKGMRSKGLPKERLKAIGAIFDEKYKLNKL